MSGVDCGAEVTLVVPGLLGPMPGWLQATDTPRFPQLERRLATADRERTTGGEMEAVLCHLFGVAREPEGDLPVAALMRLGEGKAPDRRCWVLAEPVCLRPDQSRLLLFDTLDFDLGEAGSRDLAELFRSHFDERGWVLETGSPARWYLGMERVPALQTHFLGEVFGRNMDLFLPRGGERLAWHRLLNEVQMLFFQAEVNQRREAQGRMPVNGIWFSGVGRLPARVRAPFDMVHGDAPLLRGLALAAGIPLAALPAKGELPADGVRRPLLLYPGLRRAVWTADPHAWAEGLEGFGSWLSCWIDAVRRRRFQAITLYSCDGFRWRITRSTLRRWWRRPRPLLDLSRDSA
ncbi:MAG TPA: hypothetical protein ENI96_11110 [Sedimenticola thiotaurini]|uniref:Regulatory protein, RpfE type n=1 Tax=Sedimenticola thiotaurini TaxID=1543721 RepID=A0A831W3U7_9GAMM|nr:hypothetical protein [Sedimenticola thiotaurini]